MIMTLKLKILIHLAVITTVIFLIFSFTILRSYRNDYLEAIRMRSSALASLVKKKAEDQMSSPSGTSGFSLLSLDLKKIVDSNEHVTSAFIVSVEGKVLAHNDISLINTPIPRELMETINKKSIEGVFKSGNSYITLVPILERGRPTRAFMLIGFPAAILEEKIRGIVINFFILLSISLFVSYIAGNFFVLSEVVKPLSTINNIAEKVAAGNLTLAASKRDDEFGALTSSFNNMTESLKMILRKITEVAMKLTTVARMMFHQSQKVQTGSVAQSQGLDDISGRVQGLNASVQEASRMVEGLSKLSQEASSSTLEMTASIQEVEANALKLKETGEDISGSIIQISTSLKDVHENVESLTKNTDNTMSSVTEMNMSIKEVENHASETAHISQEVATDAEEGMKSVALTAQGMTAIKNAVQETATIIKSLGDRSAQIGEILTVISQVIDQTNLLALNAAIIATQAGEYGKGFSVVAQEIRNLAERTSASTQDIAKLIEGVQSETARAVASVDAGLKSVTDGEELSSHSARILEKIGDSSKKAVNMVEQIARATGEHGRASLRVAEATEKISHSAHQISRATKEQALGSDLIHQATEKLKHLTLQVHRATAEQSKGSRQIAKLAEEVNASVQKFGSVMQNHRTDSEEILHTIKKNISLVNDNLDAVKSTMGVVDELVGLAAIFNEEVSRFKL